ncbi:MAG: hypothetical protein H7Y15_18605, partial [Pseudonocardia sp.]|nr:hypothetical protein [Pseudonocardia sp.]
MAQLTHSGTSNAPTGVITVADLLSRYAPDPMVEPEPAAPVSVESLLRREGHAGRDRRIDPLDELRVRIQPRPDQHALVRVVLIPV